MACPECDCQTAEQLQNEPNGADFVAARCVSCGDFSDAANFAYVV